MNLLPSQENQPLNQANEVEQLKMQVAALEQLLEVYEQETIDKSDRLEQALTDLQLHTQRLTHAESSLSTLRAMLNSMGDPVVVVDQTGQFLFLNASAESLLGIRSNCSSLQGWAETWQVYDTDQVTAYPLETFPLWQAVQGKEVNAAELFVRQSESEAAWFSVTARALADQASQIQGGIAVFHNVTDRKQAELSLRHSEVRSREQAQQLQQALDDLRRVQNQLIQAEKMSSLGQLVAGIAHEINNPVNFIQGNLIYVQEHIQDLLQFIDSLRRSCPELSPALQAEAESISLDFLLEDLPKTLRSMRIGTERIRQIVLSLRNFSRLDEADLKSTDIHEGIESALMILQHRLTPKANSAGITVNRLYENLPPIECYPGQLNQVFINILSNAIDALENQTTGQITIRTSMTNERVTIAIADNGCGISEQNYARIFDPFFTTKAVGKGTGMGLSISYQIITETHKGKLEVVSQPGQGSQFLIQIPVKQTVYSSVKPHR